MPRIWQREHIIELATYLVDLNDLHDPGYTASLICSHTNKYRINSPLGPRIFFDNIEYTCNIDYVQVRNDSTKTNKLIYFDHMTVKEYPVAKEIMTLMISVYERKLICETIVK